MRQLLFFSLFACLSLVALWQVPLWCKFHHRQASRYKQVPLHLALALKDEGIRERPIRSNSGDSIDRWNKHFGLRKVPWCATWLSAKLRHANVKMRGSARARDFVTKQSYSLKSVIYNIYKPKPGDLRVKARKGGNHVDIIESDTTLIGGNVSDAVTRRKWSLASFVRDGTTHITPVISRRVWIPTDHSRRSQHAAKSVRRSKRTSED